MQTRSFVPKICIDAGHVSENTLLHKKNYVKVYIVRASLNSRHYISLSVIPVVEISAALE